MDYTAKTHNKKTLNNKQAFKFCINKHPSEFSFIKNNNNNNRGVINISVRTYLHAFSFWMYETP